MIWKNTMAVLMVLALLTTSLVVVGNSASAEEGESADFMATTPHAPIHIDGDSDFDNQAASEGWDGSGTRDDPYIIEGYSITSTDSTLPIHILNTTRYFSIVNCTITLEESSTARYGIYLRNITNEFAYYWPLAHIDNVTLTGNGEGTQSAIYVDEVNSTTISNTKIENFRAGIYSRYSSYHYFYIININDNEIHTFNSAIVIEQGGFGKVERNNITAGGYGIYWATPSVLQTSQINDNTITVLNTGSVGVFLVGDSRVNLKGNHIRGGIGIRSWLDSATILSNVFENNSVAISILNGGSGVELIEDNLIKNASTGISISSYYIDYHAIRNNVIYTSGISIYIGITMLTDDVILSNNTMYGQGIYFNLQGLSAMPSTGKFIVSPSNLLYGRPVIFLDGVDMHGMRSPTKVGQVILFNVKNYIVDGINTPNKPYSSLEILHSENITVVNSTLSGSYYGLLCTYSRNIVVTHNNVSGDSGTAVRVSRSSNSLFFENAFYGDGQASNNDNNMWYYGDRGNYWYPWVLTHEDADGDGIIDEPYILNDIDGYADPYPLAISPLIVPPSAPVNIQAIAGNNSVVISWEEPLNDGGSKILGYRIYRGESSEDLKLYAEVDASTMEYRDDDVFNGETYFYSVTSVNVGGEGEGSEVVKATPVTEPSAPTNLVVSTDGNTALLSWGYPVDDGGSSIREFRIYRNGEFLCSVSAETTKFLDTNLNYGTPYFYWVTAVNGAGESVRSSNITIIPKAPPESPRNFTARIINETLVLSWEPGASNGAEIVEYRVYYNGNLYASTNSTSIVFQYWNSGVYYVTALNSEGESKQTKSVYIQVSNLPESPEDNNTGTIPEKPEENDTEDNNTGTPEIIYVGGETSPWLWIALLMNAGVIALLAYLIVSTRPKKGATPSQGGESGNSDRQSPSQTRTNREE